MDISVIVPTYNRAASLRVTLQGLLSQVLPADLSWELLVVNNNSDDETCEVTRMFAATASVPVRYVFEQRQGRSSALNAGIAAAIGEIIALTDDDVRGHGVWLQAGPGRGKDHVLPECDCLSSSGSASYHEGLLSQMVLQRRQVDRTSRRRFKRRHLLFRDSALDVARCVHSFCKMVSKP